MASAVLLSSLATGVEFQPVPSGVGLASSRPVFVYLRGTTTQVQVYSDAGLTVPVSQPVTTGSNGIPGAIPGYIAGGVSIDFVDQTSGARTEAEPLVAADVIGSDGKIGGPGTVGLSSSASPVSSVFTRSGAITAQSGDYTIAQIGAGTVALSGVGLVWTGGAWVAASVAYDWTVNVAPATTRYVSPSGSGNGLAPTTPASLASAQTAAQPGDTINFLPGVYSLAAQQFLTQSGLPGAPITYKPLYGWHTVLIQWTGGTHSGGIFQTNSLTPWAGAHHIVFQDLVLDGANGIGIGLAVTNGAHHVAVKRCRIRNMGATGIAFNATDYCVAERNLIWHCGYNQGDSSGISLWYGGSGGYVGGAGTGQANNPAYDTYTGFHNIIVGNVISGQFDGSVNHTDGNGIIVDGSQFTTPIPPALIYGNVIFHCGGRGIENNANGGDVWVINNTVYQNGLDTTVAAGLAADLFDNSSGGRWFNNLVYSRFDGATYTTAKPADFGAATIIAQSNNLLANGTTLAGAIFPAYAGNPSLASAPALPSAPAYSNAIPPWNLGGGLALGSTSAAIDAGIDPMGVISPKLVADLKFWLDKGDALGQKRYAGRGIDIGAYEYQGNP